MGVCGGLLKYVLNKIIAKKMQLLHFPDNELDMKKIGDPYDRILKKF